MLFEKCTIILLLITLVISFVLLFFVTKPYWLNYIEGELIWDPRRDRIRVLGHVGLFLFNLTLLYVIVGISSPYTFSTKVLIGLLFLIVIIALSIGAVFYFYEEKFLNKSNINEFKSLFENRVFNQIMSELKKLNILEESGKWNISGPLKNKRDISILISILIGNAMLPANNYKETHRLARLYFQVDFNYEEMTKLIKNYKDNDAESKDVKSYKLLAFIENIRC